MDVARTRESKPNLLLRQERLLRGWSQSKVAEEVGTNTDTVSKWERGINIPDSFFREKLCKLYGKNAIELGFIEEISSFHTPPLATVAYNESQGSQTPLQVGPTGQEEEVHMNRMRRLILQGMLEIVGTSLILPPQELASDILDRIDYAALKSSDASMDNSTLAHFTKVTEGCWHLTIDSGLVIAVPVIKQTLSTYLSKISMLAQQPLTKQKEIAQIAAQGYLLAGLVALDESNYAAMDAYSKRAIQFSIIAEDTNSHAAALKQQATSFQFAKNPAQTLRTYQSIIPFIKQVAPLLQSRVYQGLASAAARCGKEEDALNYLSLAYDTFPNNMKDDPSFLYADSNLPTLHLYAGLTLLELDQPEKAWEAFSRVDGIQPKMQIGDWTRLEFLNLQTKTSTLLKDREQSLLYLRTSMELSNALNSQTGRREAMEAWQQMRIAWSGDKTIKGLSELLV